MTRSAYGTAFALWRGTAPEWEAYTRHPFVEGLPDGTLSRCFATPMQLEVGLWQMGLDAA